MLTGTSAETQKWWIVAIAAVILATIMGQLVNGMSSFFRPLEEAYGWARADIALINTSGLVGLAVGGIAMGMLADRIGARPVVILGVTVSSVAFVTASFSQSLWQLYAIFFLAGTFGGGAVFGPLIVLVGRWFSTGAGLALGLVAAGQAIGQGGVPYVNVALIEVFGWQGALLVFGAGTGLGLLPLACMVKSPPAQPMTMSVAPSSTPLPLGFVVPMMATAVFWCCTLMSVPLMHLLPLMEACGIPSSQAGLAVFVMMLAAIGGRVAFGRVADLVGPVQAWFIASLWQTSLVAVFVGIGSLSMFLIFAPIYGFGYAGVMTAILASMKALTPVQSRSSATGIVLAFAWIGHGFGGYVGGALFDATLNYTAAFGFAAIAGIVNLVIVGTLWWKMTDGHHKFAVA